MVWYSARLPAVHKTEVFGGAENVRFPPQTWLIISSGRYFPRGWKPPIILLDSMMCVGTGQYLSDCQGLLQGEVSQNWVV